MNPNQFNQFFYYNQVLPEAEKEGFRILNHFVMDHTWHMCCFDHKLNQAILESISTQKVIYQSDKLNIAMDGPTTDIVVSRKRTYEAASAYKGKKVAVLNFANNHHIGGSPWSAGAQEESLCRCSTLFPCLNAAEQDYYEPHRQAFENGTLSYDGNDDIIYTKDVIVFKSDESAPKLLSEKEWYSVDVITCAAPCLASEGNAYRRKEQYMRIIEQRITRILQVAKANGVEVLILGAFGCGAFCNPRDLMATAFKNQLAKYNIPKVEFAIYDRNPGPNDNFHVFNRILC